MQGYRLAVLGASGMVGRTLLQVLEERSFPVAKLIALTSERSAGKMLFFRGEPIATRSAEPSAFDRVELVLASAGATVSRALLPEAAQRGAVSIDNSSAYRMEEDVPLVVPEVNPHRIPQYRRRRIIANPNCSTIQLAVALKPLHDAFGVRRVQVATYQAVSGAGERALEELRGQTRAVLESKPHSREVFPRRIAFNALPHIDSFLDGGETREEWKMRVETPKILEAPLAVHATCVRVPVEVGHSEAVWIETDRRITPEAAAEALAAAPGIEVVDGEGSYPTAIDAAGSDPVYVGRMRRDPTRENALAFWVVADNLRKGAALNAVQIAEKLVGLWDRAGGREAYEATTPGVGVSAS